MSTSSNHLLRRSFKLLIVQGQNIALNFGSDTLFQKVNFQIAEQARVGLVGPNGAGKSTLLKIIVQELAPSAGKIIYKNNMRMGYLAQNPHFHSHNTIYQEMERIFDYLKQDEQRLHHLEKRLTNLTDTTTPQAQELLHQYDQLQIKFKDENGYGYRSEIRSVLSGFGFPESRQQEPALNLSGGEQSRLAFAQMLLGPHELLILDEPTNYLDIDTLNWLEKYLQTYQGALLIVSHDQYFLDHTVNEVYALENQTLKHYSGNYSAYLGQRDKDLALAWKAYNKQQEEIQKTEAFIQKNIVRASTTKRAQSRRKQLAKVDRLAKPKSLQPHVRFQFKAQQTSGNEVLKIKDLQTGYKNNELKQDITFTLKKHERLAVIGPNGVGKSTLIRTLIDQIPPLQGTIKWGTNVTVGYYDQNLNQLNSNKDVLHEIWDEHPTIDEKEIRNILASFLFQDDDVFNIVHDLSGGEKARLTLCKLALKHDNLLIMDEPTNHLDIQSKEILEQALEDFAGTILFVSHDRYLLNKISTRILELEPQQSTLYLGNYDYYLAKKAEVQALAASQDNPDLTTTAHPTTGQQNYQQNKLRQRQERKRQRQITALETQIDQLEQRIATLNQAMAQSENLKDYTKLQELQQQINTLTQQKNNAEDQWAQLIE